MRKTQDERLLLMAHHMSAGMKPSKAARAAGYSPSYVRCKAAELAKSDRMVEALESVARGIRPGQLAALSKARLRNRLLTMAAGDRDEIKAIRTGLECDGELYRTPSEVHLHQHTTLPPKVQAMLEEKMAQILLKQQGVLPEPKALVIDTSPEVKID